MANILILSSDFPPARGGIATDSFNLFKLLSKRHNVHTHIFGMEGKNTDSIIYHNVPKISYLKILKELFSRNYDIIILRTMFPLAWMTAMLKPKARTILFIYGQELISRNYLKLRPSVKWTLEQMDEIISISRFTDSLIARESRIFYPLIDAVQYKSVNMKQDKKTFTIGTMGRIEPHKNHMAVLRNISLIDDALEKENRKLNYIIAGQGSNEQVLRDYVKKNNIEHIVSFMQCPDNDSRDEFYNSIDLLVMPSIRDRNHVEGFGIVVQEAGLYSKPSLGYASGGLEESLEYNSVRCAEDDEACLCKSIISMALDSSKYREEADAALARSQKYIINEKRCDEIDELLGIGSGGRI